MESLSGGVAKGGEGCESFRDAVATSGVGGPVRNTRGPNEWGCVGVPALRSLIAKPSDCMGVDSQLRRSERLSRGEAEACTPCTHTHTHMNTHTHTHTHTQTRTHTHTHAHTHTHTHTHTHRERVRGCKVARGEGVG